jgi:hypothetical protein
VELLTSLVVVPPTCSYIQMSGMVFGGMIEADNRLRMYEADMRLRRKELRSRMVRAAYERELRELEGDDGFEPPNDQGGSALPKKSNEGK